MAKGQIVAGLDIGTNTIKLLVAQKNENGIEVLSYAQIPSFGLRKGAVVNSDEVSKNIQMLTSGVEKDIGKRISSVFVNIGGNHLYVMPSDGVISVSRADHVISQEDVDRVMQATRAVSIPSNEEILDVFVKEYVVNDQRGIREPVGLTGVRLEAKVTLLCYFQSYFMNLTNAVLSSKLQIDDIVPSPLAAAEAVLTKEQKELGVLLIDIGATTTSLVIFEEGQLEHFAIFPLGSANITYDLAIGLQTDVAIAEEIKKQHGTCLSVNNQKDSKDIHQSADRKKIEIFDQSNSLSFTKKDLVDIIQPRVSEIFNHIQKELKKVGKQELLPGGVVLTGGGANLHGIRELAKQYMRLPCEIGTIKKISGLDKDPSLATVAGLALSGIDENGSEAGSIFNFSKGWGSKMRRMFRIFIP